MQRVVKRGMDLVLCLALLPFLLPLFLVVALLIKLDGGPVFFSAARIGRGRQLFRLAKFRSMIVDADRYLDAAGRPTRPRITWIGKWLRRLSIDELPQVFNILKGEMSFIGPRPVLPADLDNVPAEYQCRFDMPPGISGLAQVSGRNTLPWIDRYRLDAEYVRTWSLALDIKILFRTILVVLTGSGMVADRNPDQVRSIR